MAPPFSLYLDLVRFLAAATVFVGHLSSRPFTRELLPECTGFYGDVAVIVFFVLSGYVIAYVTCTRERTARAYLSARVSRLYSVVMICLLLTFVFDHLGMIFNPDFYRIQKVLWKPESWAGYVSSAFFVNEYQVFGFNGISPGTNAPYWSLSFEATYYLVAGLAIFQPRKIWTVLSVVILALAGKTIVALLPVWVLGFFLFRCRWEKKIPVPVSLFLFVTSIVVLVGTPKIIDHLPSDNFGCFMPWGRAPFNRNLIADYLVAFAFSLNLLSARRLITATMPIPKRLDSIGHWLGSLTFPLYCFHFPSICLLAAISPWPRNSIEHTLFLFTCTLAVVVVFTPICGKVKYLLRRTMRSNRKCTTGF